MNIAVLAEQLVFQRPVKRVAICERCDKECDAVNADGLCRDCVADGWAFCTGCDEYRRYVDADCGMCEECYEKYCENSCDNDETDCMYVAHRAAEAALIGA